MKKIIIGLVIMASVALLGFVFYTTFPKKLETPQHWSEEASAHAIVSKVRANGIEVRFTEKKIKGKTVFLPGERGYTNGQPVCIRCTVYYARYYDTGFGAIQWVHRSVEPILASSQ